MRFERISIEYLGRFRYQTYSHDDRPPNNANTEITRDKKEYIK